MIITNNIFNKQLTVLNFYVFVLHEKYFYCVFWKGKESRRT